MVKNITTKNIASKRMKNSKRDRGGVTGEKRQDSLS